MRNTLIAVVTLTSLVAVGATALAAQPAKTTGDDLFAKASTTVSAAEKAEPLKGVNIKSIRLGDDDMGHGLRSERGEKGEGMDD